MVRIDWWSRNGTSGSEIPPKSDENTLVGSEISPKNRKNRKNEIPDIGSVLHSSCFGDHPTIIVDL